MQNLYKDLEDILRKDERLFSENKLLKNKVTELALKLDSDLISLILQTDKIKDHFTVKVGEVTVFDKDKFIKFINNKEFLPNSFTTYKNHIGLMKGNEYLKNNDNIVLAWPYKDCVLEGGQNKEDSKRDEIFYNETLAPDEIDRLFEPKVLTNFKRIDASGEHSVDSITEADNLIIKGNNLLVLHSLKRKYRNSVKLIYIDPPYNTGNDSFKYNDSFKHSTWLTFMKNRLEVAKELLSNNGVILIHCDYIEEAYLKILMDEVFSRDNYINTITVRDSHPSGLKLSAKEKTIIKTASSILVYKKEDLTIRPIYQKRADWDTHFNLFVDINSKDLRRYSLQKFLIEQGVVSKEFKLNSGALQDKKFREFAFANRNSIFQSTKEIPDYGKKLSLENKDNVVEYTKGEYALNGRRLSPLSKSIQDVGFDGYKCEDFGKLLCDFWDDVDFNNSQSEGGVSLPSGKKPEYLLARLMTMFSNQGDLILDYHLGSGTTCAVAHKMNRRYIGIEQINYGQNDPVNRLRNIIKGDGSGISEELGWQGGGSLISMELKEWNEAYARELEEASNSQEIAKIYNKMLEEAFFRYDVDLSKFSENDLAMLPLEDQKKVLLECLDKNHLYVNIGEMNDSTYQVEENDKKINRLFYGN